MTKAIPYRGQAQLNIQLKSGGDLGLGGFSNPSGQDNDSLQAYVEYKEPLAKSPRPKLTAKQKHDQRRRVRMQRIEDQER